MIERPFWVSRIRQAWTRAPIAWLSGVRRVGKTTLAKSLASARYLNCDLPSTAELLRDPEPFFESVHEPIVILDEVHQLPDPSRLLKIAAVDVIALENSISRARAIVALVSTGAKLLVARELEYRLQALETAMKPREPAKLGRRR